MLCCFGARKKTGGCVVECQLSSFIGLICPSDPPNLIVLAGLYSFTLLPPAPGLACFQTKYSSLEIEKPARP